MANVDNPRSLTLNSNKTIHVTQKFLTSGTSFMPFDINLRNIR